MPDRTDNVAAPAAKLEEVAALCATHLGERPGAAGIVLYGSLAYGHPDDRTPFSDVDLILLLDGKMPAHFSEHRLVDLVLLPHETLRTLAEGPLKRLYQHDWLVQYLLKSLLLGEEWVILHDPDGSVLDTRQRIRARVTYDALLRPDVRPWAELYVRQHETPMEEDLEAGDWQDAWDHASAAVWHLGGIPRMLARRKDLKAATDELGLTRFYEAASALRRLVAPDAGALGAYREAARALWAFTRERVFSAACAELVRTGVADPLTVELAGDHPLFWPGNRIHEMGRLVSEVDLSFTWSEYAQERGDLLDAQMLLWACDPEHDAKRCRGLAAALEQTGPDIHPIVTASLEDPEYHRLSVHADGLARRMQKTAVSPRAAREAVGLALTMRRELAPALA